MPTLRAFHRKFFADSIRSFDLDGRLASFANDSSGRPVRLHISPPDKCGINIGQQRLANPRLSHKAYGRLTFQTSSICVPALRITLATGQKR